MMHKALPTTDLYFLNSCRPLIKRWWRRGLIVREGANSFRCGNRFLLIRRDQPDVMEKALAWSGPLIYLIDDDIPGAASSPALPAPYRARLKEFETRYYGRLLQRADMIVASSDALAGTLTANRHVAAEIVRMDPYWGLPFADQRHFADEGLSIVHLGTASHRGALTRITPAIMAALDGAPTARFTFIGRAGDHPALEAHPAVRRFDVKKWRRYRRWLPRQRFHLALYPLEQTRFDLARSANKIFEHAAVGAVGMYPRSWAPARLVGEGSILAPDEPIDWHKSIALAIERRTTLARLAKIAQTKLEARDEGATQKRRWRTLLDFEPDPSDFS